LDILLELLQFESLVVEAQLNLMVSQTSDLSQLEQEYFVSCESRESNTRLNSQVTPETTLDGFGIGWDWYQLTGKLEGGQLYPLIELIENATNEKILLRPGNPTTVGAKYQNSGMSFMGVKVAWDDKNANGDYRMLVSIPGKVLMKLTLRQQYDLASVLVGTGLKFTRSDGRMDDYGKTIKPIQVIAALEVGNYAKFKSKRLITKFQGDWTIYLGSSESARSTKYYNKEAQLKGEIKAWRWETRFGQTLAHKVMQEWLDIRPEDYGDCWEQEASKFIARSIIGSIDFIDRESKPNEKNISRIPRLEWWEDFIDLVGKGIYHTKPVIKTTLERVTGWMKKSVFRTMACVLWAMGRIDAQSWMIARLEEAELSMNKRHQKMIQQFTNEYEIYKNQVACGYA
jgi:hypothetical protein